MLLSDPSYSKSFLLNGHLNKVLVFQFVPTAIAEEEADEF